ncbi:MAG: hypothetical protein K6L76_01675 [Agarilytica sp.]
MNELIQNTGTSTPIASNINLERLDDEAIKSLIADSYKLLDRRKREREKNIKEQIKELAATEGIKVSFREPSARKKRTLSTTESN